MFRATAQIKRVFDLKGVAYQIVDRPGLSYIEAGVRGENYPTLDVCFFSRDDDSDVSVRVMQISRAPAGKMAEMLSAVNDCNRRYRHVKFVIDESGSVNLEYDMPMSNTGVGEAALEMMIRITKTLEEVYPVFLSIRYA